MFLNPAPRVLNRIDRYLLRELFAPFVVCLSTVVGLIFLFQARRFAHAALGLGLSAEDGLVILIAALPPFLVFAVPIACMASVLVGLGRVGIDLELIVLRALGVSPWRIVWSTLLFGAVLSALCLPIALFGEPYGLQSLHDRLVDVGLKNLTRTIRAGEFNESFSGSALYAEKVSKAGELFDVLLYDEKDHGRPMLATAAKGQLRVTPEREVLFELQQGEVHLGTSTSSERYDRIRFEKATIRLDAGERIVQRTRFISILGRQSNQALLDTAHNAGMHTPFARRVLKTYWRRFALPSLSLVFALVGAAIVLSGAPRARVRQAVLGLGAIVLYYVLTRIADLAVVRFTHSAFFGAFGPNLILLSLGILGIYRARRATR